jgi:hypothetical protein
MPKNVIDIGPGKDGGSPSSTIASSQMTPPQGEPTMQRRAGGEIGRPSPIALAKVKKTSSCRNRKIYQ